MLETRFVAEATGSWHISLDSLTSAAAVVDRGHASEFSLKWSLLSKSLAQKCEVVNTSRNPSTKGESPMAECPSLPSFGRTILRCTLHCSNEGLIFQFCLV